MHAEFLIETGALDDAARTLERLRPRATGMNSYFSWGLRARLAAIRGDTDTLREAWDEISAMSESASQQPVPHAMGLLARAEEALWAGRVAQAVEVAREALVRVQEDDFYRAEAIALLARAEADQADATARAGRVVAPPDDGLGRSTRSTHRCGRRRSQPSRSGPAATDAVIPDPGGKPSRHGSPPRTSITWRAREGRSPGRCSARAPAAPRPPVSSTWPGPPPALFARHPVGRDRRLWPARTGCRSAACSPPRAS